MAAPRPPIFSATPAFTRSTVLAAGLTVLSVLAGRPDLLVVAVPFVVHAVWAWWRRPDANANPTVSTRPRLAEIAEGESVLIHSEASDAPAATWLSVQWPAMTGATWNPTFAAATDLADETITVHLEPARWGRYVSEQPGVQMVDESGSWRAVQVAEPTVIKVRPAAATLQGSSGVARPIGLTGAHLSSVRGDGTQIADIREYRAGDRLRRINWRVTSRTRKLHVTQTFTERDTDVLVVADTLRDLPDPVGDSSSLDATVRAIAAISQHYIGFGDRVGVHDLGHRVGVIRAGTGPRQSKIIAERLSATLREVGDHLHLRRVHRLRSGTLVYFCSPLLDDKVLDELIRLRQLGGEVIVIDTMPVALGLTSSFGPAVPGSFMDEAWVIRRMQRESTLLRVRHLGVPVTAWQGPASLASVLLAMEAARSAPRMAVGR